MIVLDIETTGIDPRRHSIVEAGALSRLICGRDMFEEFAGYAIPDYLQK